MGERKTARDPLDGLQKGEHMNIEKMLDQLARLDVYKTGILRDQLDRYNDRKTLALVGRLLLAFVALMVYLLKG